jgi:hypothetical protein
MTEQACLIPFQLPKNISVQGATQAGKTEFVKRLLINYKAMFTPQVEKIIYVYSVWQDNFGDLENILGDIIEFRKDIPSKKYLTELWETYRAHSLLVLDDQMSNLNDNLQGSHVAEIVCVLSHHCHVSCIITLQDMFYESKAARLISRNSHCICLFRNHRNGRQVSSLASQVLPGETKYFMDSYERATKRSYGYLIIDLSPNVDKRYKLRSNIFPGEETIVFLPQS